MSMDYGCVRMEHFSSLSWFSGNLSVIRKIVQKIQISLKSNKKMTTTSHFWSYLAEFFLEWKMLHTEVVEEIKTHFVFNNIFFENPTIYEIMWKNIVQWVRPHMTWQILIACWISKDTHTLTCNTCCFSTDSWKKMNQSYIIQTLSFMFILLMLCLFIPHEIMYTQLPHIHLLIYL